MKRSDLQLIKRALYDAELIRLRRYDSLPRVEKEHTEEYKKKISLLLEGEEKGLYTDRTVVKKRWLLATVVTIIIALTVTACAVIEPIRTVIAEFFENCIKFSTSSGDGDVSMEEYGLYYLPEGFEKTNEEKDVNLIRIEYKNNGEQIVFIQTRISGVMTFDEEHYVTEVAGKEVFVFTKAESDVVFWTDENYKYTVYYPEELDFSEVRKMIESVAPIGE